MPVVKVDVESEGAFDHKAMEPAPPGVYICSLRETPLVIEESSGGNPMVVAHLTIEADENGDPTPEQGKPIFNYVVLSSKSGKPIINPISHLAMCFGAMSEEEIRASGGEIDTDIFTADMRGKVQLGVQPAKDGYQAKNTVRKYLW